MSFGDIFGQKCGQQIARHLSSTGIHNADPVTITVKPDSKVSACGLHLGAKNVECLWVNRIGMVIWKGAVDFGKQHLVGAIKSGNKPFRDRAAGAVAAVPDD